MSSSTYQQGTRVRHLNCVTGGWGPSVEMDLGKDQVGTPIRLAAHVHRTGNDGSSLPTVLSLSHLMRDPF